MILDTNVVFDWLVFKNPEGLQIGRLIASGDVRWIATPAMQSESAHVLARCVLDAWLPDASMIAQAWATHAEFVEPAPTAAARVPRCTDPDDQIFIDLACQLGNASLLSRDRAVLKLARRARTLGAQILAPSDWLKRRAAVALR